MRAKDCRTACHDDWVHASSGSVFLETSDNTICKARLRVEGWDGSAEIDDGYWLDQVCISLDLPTARFFVDQSDVGPGQGTEPVIARPLAAANQPT
ncbi:hypothetical protein ABZW32_30280 [Streptomyces sp. NPDC004667]|uniref:hypothetical protein n=1 Tax=Streptomyces sp. NPDC004667 TaxID=3154285 RepID=UPI0033A167E5